MCTLLHDQLFVCIPFQSAMSVLARLELVITPLVGIEEIDVNRTPMPDALASSLADAATSKEPMRSLHVSLGALFINV